MNDNKKTFAERHPRLNFIIGFILLIFICIGGFFLVNWSIALLGEAVIGIKDFLKVFVNSTDKVIVVAMITGAVSIVGVVISSIVAKIIDST